LEYTKQTYEEKRYVSHPIPGGGFDRSEWLNEKFNLGLDFPNLPFYEDENVKLSQSNAILRYVGRKAGLEGKNDVEKAHVDMLIEQVFDLRNLCTGLYYSDKFQERLKPFLEVNLPNSLQTFEKYLGNKTWLIGDNITLPDFHFAELLDQILLLEPKIFDKFPKLKAYHQRFFELPAIVAYMKTERFIKYPINNPSAAWGGKLQS